VIVLHGVKYYTAEDIAKYLPVTLEEVVEKINNGELESCLIDGKVFVLEEDMLQMFKSAKR